MQFRFITIMHNLNLDNVKNRGISIFKGARISNGYQILTETLNSEQMKYTLGAHSSDEFENTTYLYIDGQLDEINTKEEMDEIGGKYTFYLLRLAQWFTHELWSVKDNDVYIRDGFLLAYSKEFRDGFTYKASLFSIYSYSNARQIGSVFTDHEISIASSKFESSPHQNEFDYKIPVSDIFIKSKGSERLDRASYFTLEARSMHILPMKIVFYISALECLFTVGNQEISHKVSERIAILLENDPKSRRQIFDIIKRGYSIRSRLVHGQYIKVLDGLDEVSESLDGILRTLFNEYKDIFKMDDEKMEDYFTNLIFDNND